MDTRLNFPRLLRRAVLTAGLCAASGVPGADAPAAGEVCVAHVFTGANGKTLPYRQLSPAVVEAGTRYPLVLFLHGAGERGADNTRQMQWVVPLFARPETRAKHPCFLIAPQCPEGKRWVEVDWGAAGHALPPEPAESLALALELVDQAVKTLPVDPARVYICGLSMGGYGTWDAASRRPGFFAAAIPVCGGGDVAQAPKLARLPLWAFHGADDTVVKPARTTAMVEAIRAAGGEPKLTIFPGVGHNAWSPAFDDPKTLEWLFARRRAE